MLSSAGVGVKIGGLVATSVGRAHRPGPGLPALGFLHRPTPVALAADPSPHVWEVVDGLLLPLDDAAWKSGPATDLYRTTSSAPPALLPS